MLYVFEGQNRDGHEHTLESPTWQRYSSHFIAIDFELLHVGTEQTSEESEGWMRTLVDDITSLLVLYYSARVMVMNLMYLVLG